MDFRSQLSAFQKSGGSGGATGQGNPPGNDEGRSHYNRNDRSPGRHSHNQDNNRRNYGRGGSEFGRGGGGDIRGGGDIGRDQRDNARRGGGDGKDIRASIGDYGPGGSDRRRLRPQEWNSRQEEPPSVRRRFRAPDPDGLGDLRRFGYRIPNGFPEPPTPEEKAKKPKHVALLAITIDDLPYENIWKGWCEALSKTLEEHEGVDEYFVSLVCHAKHPNKVQSEWLRQRLLTHPPKPGRGNSYLDPEFLTRIPSWGSIEITRAMLDLLQDGLKIGNCTETDKRFAASRFLIRSPKSFDAVGDPTVVIADTERGNGGGVNSIPPVDHFLYISETCLPVVTAWEFFDRIQDSTVSWVNARHRKQEDTPKNKYEDDQFAGINRRVPGQYRWKGDQWILLSRRHASKIFDLDHPHISPKHQLWQSFRDINASDEMYFPTMLALLGYLRFTSDGEDTQRQRIPIAPNPQATDLGDKGDTFSSDTSPSASKNGCILLKPVTYTDWSEGMKNPATFSRGVTDLKRVGKVARDKGCLIARKFAPYIAVPGVPKREQRITGEISMMEWEAVIKELQNIEETEKAAIPERTKRYTVREGKDSDEPEKEGRSDGGHVNENNDNKAELAGQPSAPSLMNGHDDEEEEGDEDENQLE